MLKSLEVGDTSLNKKTKISVSRSFYFCVNVIYKKIIILKQIIIPLRTVNFLFCVILSWIYWCDVLSQTLISNSPFVSNLKFYCIKKYFKA